jgi:hypothetical protein
MPTLRLRLRNGAVAEKLPGRCLFCGARVLTLRLKVVPDGGCQLYLQLPICDRDRKVGSYTIDHTHGTAGRVMDAASSRSPILWVFWSLFQLFNWAGTAKQARGDQFLVVRGVCPEFLDALDEMEDREDPVPGDEADGDPGAPRRRKSAGS